MRKPAQEVSRKVREVRKVMKGGNEEMEGGNGVREANGITQFAEGEPKRWNNDNFRVYQPLKGGNEANAVSVVTLCLYAEIVQALHAQIARKYQDQLLQILQQFNQIQLLQILQ